MIFRHIYYVKLNVVNININDKEMIMIMIFPHIYYVKLNVVSLMQFDTGST